MSAEIPAGAIRFNTDSQRLEFYAQGEWWVMSTDTPNLGTSADRQPGARGLAMGGYHPSNAYLDEIVYINIASTGNSLAFGELTVSDRNHVNMGTSDRTRAISAGGSKFPGVLTGDIEYVTMASTGNAVDFGADMFVTRYGGASASNGTRGIFAGGWNGSTQLADIEYITIQSTGVAAQDFGDLTLARNYPASGMCSSTRAVFAGGRQQPTPAYYNTIDYITMSTQGNAADFGDLTEPRGLGTQGITSNSVRGITAGGYVAPLFYNYIDYITIPTLGNAIDFGDLLSVGGSSMGVTSSTRCVVIGGAAPAYTNAIQYVQIMTTGNAVDFGDMHTQVTSWGAGASNAHGGL